MTLVADDEAPVEQATAGPGEKRSTRRSGAQQRKRLLARRQEAQDAGDGATVNEVDAELAGLGDD